MKVNKPILISVPTVLTMNLSKSVSIEFHEDGAVKILGTNDVIGAVMFYEHLETIASRSVNFSPGKIKLQKIEIAKLNQEIFKLKKKIKESRPVPVNNTIAALERFDYEDEA